MFKRKPKVLTPEQAEELRTKDFFDMILPGTVKFLSDHYILGDSYRCVWVIREYPPSTEEQAILAQLADRSGVTLRIKRHGSWHRLLRQGIHRTSRHRMSGIRLQGNCSAEYAVSLTAIIIIRPPISSPLPHTDV